MVECVNLAKLLVKFNLFCWFYNKARIWKPTTLWNKTIMNTELSLDLKKEEKLYLFPPQALLS